MGASVTDEAISFAIPRLRGPDALSSAESTQMKFIQRMNEQPSSWVLLFGTAAILGYFLFLVGDGMTW